MFSIPGVELGPVNKVEISALVSIPKTLLNQMRDYMAKFSTRAEFNPGIERPPRNRPLKSLILCLTVTYLLTATSIDKNSFKEK